MKAFAFSFVARLTIPALVSVSFCYLRLTLERISI